MVNPAQKVLFVLTRTTCKFDSVSLPGAGLSGGIPSRQCALVFSQKMIAGLLPAFAAAIKYRRQRACFSYEFRIQAGPIPDARAAIRSSIKDKPG
jgi:hypothetical protein